MGRETMCILHCQQGQWRSVFVLLRGALGSVVERAGLRGPPGGRGDGATRGGQQVLFSAPGGYS